MITVWRSDLGEPGFGRIEVTGATPVERISDELLEDIKRSDQFGTNPFVTWDAANRAVTFHTANLGNLVYVIGEYDRETNSHEMHWPD